MKLLAPQRVARSSALKVAATSSSSATTDEPEDNASCNPSSHAFALNVDTPAGGQIEAGAQVQVGGNDIQTGIVEDDDCLELPGSYDGAGSPKKRELHLYFALDRLLIIRCASRSLH